MSKDHPMRVDQYPSSVMAISLELTPLSRCHFFQTDLFYSATHLTTQKSPPPQKKKKKKCKSGLKRGVGAWSGVEEKGSEEGWFSVRRSAVPEFWCFPVMVYVHCHFPDLDQQKILMMWLQCPYRFQSNLRQSSRWGKETLWTWQWWRHRMTSTRCPTCGSSRTRPTVQTRHHPSSSTTAPPSWPTSTLLIWRMKRCKRSRGSTAESSTINTRGSLWRLRSRWKMSQWVSQEKRRDWQHSKDWKFCARVHVLHCAASSLRCITLCCKAALLLRNYALSLN